MRHKKYWLLLICITIFLISDLALSAKNKADSIYDIYHTVSVLNPDNLNKRFDLLCQVYEEYLYSDPSKTLEFLPVMLELALKINDIKFIGEVHSKKAVVYRKLGMYEQSIIHFQKSKDLFLSIGDSSGYAWTLTDVGNVYYKLEMYQKAHDYYQQSLNNFRRRGRIVGERVNLNNIGMVLKSMKLYDSAITCHHHAAQICRNLNDFVGLALCYDNVAQNYLMKNDLNASLKYIDSAEHFLYIKLNDSNAGNEAKLISTNLMKTKSGIFEAKGDLPGAIEQMNKILEFNYLNNFHSNNTEIKYLLATLYIKSNQLVLSEKFAVSSLKDAEKLQLIESIVKSYRLLAEIYEVKGNYRKSFEHYTKYAAMKDSLFNQRVAGSLAALELNEQTKEDKHVIKVLEEDVQYQQVLIDKKNDFIMFLAICAFLITALAFLLYDAYKTKVQSSEQLKEINQRLEVTNSKLEESEYKLIEINQTKDKIFSIVAHDLKNSVGSFRQIVELLSGDYYSISEDEKKEFLELIKISSNQLYNLMENLLLWSRIQTGQIKVEVQQCQFHGLIKEIISGIDIGKMKTEYSVDLSDEVCIKCDPNILNYIIRNLVDNSIKHSSAEKIKFQCKSFNDDFIELSISDNGTGINKEDLKTIETSNYISGNSNSKPGLGFSIVKELIKLMSGRFKIESTVGKGTIVKIFIPIYK
ncbi:MAG: tetratricopeptide repeat-containing sensor histidine kinase [Candidatus Kapabacteria bacterium]|jgi:signal transduction histidine kinase|nr:tetratricopeptide repeat-containing sensor histidine kinase [Candidatus Kapabacteria bacterium]